MCPGLRLQPHSVGHWINVSALHINVTISLDKMEWGQHDMLKVTADQCRNE